MLSSRQNNILKDNNTYTKEDLIKYAKFHNLVSSMGYTQSSSQSSPQIPMGYTQPMMPIGYQQAPMPMYQGQSQFGFQQPYPIDAGLTRDERDEIRRLIYKSIRRKP